MAEQRIRHADGSTTVHDDHYGFGSINVGLPSRPEPPKVEDPKLDRRQIMKRRGWTDADWELAQSHGFPTSTDRRFPAGEWSITLLWRQSVVDRWVSEQRAKAEQILRLVG